MTVGALTARVGAAMNEGNGGQGATAGREGTTWPASLPPADSTSGKLALRWHSVSFCNYLNQDRLNSTLKRETALPHRASGQHSRLN
jgi:hypothetical protein